MRREVCHMELQQEIDKTRAEIRTDGYPFQ
jgi:hypothetical protein